jgi:hypothetical protein
LQNLNRDLERVILSSYLESPWLSMLQQMRNSMA